MSLHAVDDSSAAVHVMAKDIHPSFLRRCASIELPHFIGQYGQLIAESIDCTRRTSELIVDHTVYAAFDSTFYIANNVFFRRRLSSHSSRESTGAVPGGVKGEFGSFLMWATGPFILDVIDNIVEDSIAIIFSRQQRRRIQHGSRIGSVCSSSWTPLGLGFIVHMIQILVRFVDDIGELMLPIHHGFTFRRIISLRPAVKPVAVLGKVLKSFFS
mmetsp:Transcript_23485/g.49164  ORF Transcript_23485/g.49164 Transcript_23485/m.49164 type:complete len:214 (+) Transcript_23485:4508-5149(+)